MNEASFVSQKRCSRKAFSLRCHSRRTSAPQRYFRKTSHKSAALEKLFRCDATVEELLRHNATFAKIFSLQRCSRKAFSLSKNCCATTLLSQKFSRYSAALERLSRSRTTSAPQRYPRNFCTTTLFRRNSTMQLDATIIYELSRWEILLLRARRPLI